MLWLFGQIWLWLLIAFALGALSTALVLQPPWRRRAAEQTTGAPTGQHHRQPSSEHPGTAMLPPVSAEEQTGMLPTTGTLPAGETEQELAERESADAQSTRTRHATTRAAHRTARARTPRTPDIEHNADEGALHGSLDDWAGTGSTSGTLPPRRAWHARNEWPDEADVDATGHDIPRSGG